MCHFARAQKNRTRYEKEAVETVSTFDIIDYLFYQPQLVHVHANLRYLMFVFAILSTRPILSRRVLSKVHRWAIQISRSDLFTKLEDGIHIVGTGLLTREKEVTEPRKQEHKRWLRCCWLYSELRWWKVAWFVQDMTRAKESLLQQKKSIWMKMDCGRKFVWSGFQMSAEAQVWSVRENTLRPKRTQWKSGDWRQFQKHILLTAATKRYQWTFPILYSLHNIQVRWKDTKEVNITPIGSENKLGRAQGFISHSWF